MASLIVSTKITTVVTLDSFFNPEELPLQRIITINPWTQVGINNKELKDLVLVEDGQETILLSDLPPENELTQDEYNKKLSINEVFNTNNPNYFVYTAFEWVEKEGGYVNHYLYDLANKRTIPNIVNPKNGQFIKNDSYFLTCRTSYEVNMEIEYFPEVNIYNVPSFTLYKTIDLEQIDNLIYCGEFNDQNNTIEVYVPKKDGSYENTINTVPLNF
jgi:hypothetical protein